MTSKVSTTIHSNRIVYARGPVPAAPQRVQHQASLATFAVTPALAPVAFTSLPVAPAATFSAAPASAPVATPATITAETFADATATTAASDWTATTSFGAATATTTPTVGVSTSTAAPTSNDDTVLASDFNNFKREAGQKSRDRISGALFYIVLIAVLAVLYTQTADMQSGVPHHIAGYSAMRVLTGSMQSEIPKDSLIITQRVAAADIRVGDDITFLINESTTMTHRVIMIYENYADTGQRGFQTQGIENPLPDRNIVVPENIIGRVVFHNLQIGQALRIVSENVLITGIMASLLICFFVVLKFVFKPKTDEEEITEQFQSLTPQTALPALSK